MWHQTYGYLPSRKASPPIGWYQIILLCDRGRRVLTCTALIGSTVKYWLYYAELWPNTAGLWKGCVLSMWTKLSRLQVTIEYPHKIHVCGSKINKQIMSTVTVVSHIVGRLAMWWMDMMVSPAQLPLLISKLRPPHRPTVHHALAVHQISCACHQHAESQHLHLSLRGSLWQA